MSQAVYPAVWLHCYNVCSTRKGSIFLLIFYFLLFLQWITPAEILCWSKRHELAENKQKHSFLALLTSINMRSITAEAWKSHHKFCNKCSTSVQPAGNSYEGELVSENDCIKGNESLDTEIDSATCEWLVQVNTRMRNVHIWWKRDEDRMKKKKIIKKNLPKFVIH